MRVPYPRAVCVHLTLVLYVCTCLSSQAHRQVELEVSSRPVTAKAAEKAEAQVEGQLAGGVDGQVVERGGRSRRRRWVEGWGLRQRS